jgi:hypothetical protein
MVNFWLCTKPYISFPQKTAKNVEKRGLQICTNLLLLKGQCHEIFNPRFFTLKICPGPLLSLGLPNKNIRACGVIDTACTMFALENRAYLGAFETGFKKAFSRESGPAGVLFDEKTEGQKSHDIVSLIGM